MAIEDERRAMHAVKYNAMHAVKYSAMHAVKCRVRNALCSSEAAGADDLGDPLRQVFVVLRLIIGERR